jgi:hypothetical protein
LFESTRPIRKDKLMPDTTLKLARVRAALLAVPLIYRGSLFEMLIISRDLAELATLLLP